MLDDCRHSPQFDQPEQTLALMTGFLEKLARIEAVEAGVV